MLELIEFFVDLDMGMTGFPSLRSSRASERMVVTFPCLDAPNRVGLVKAGDESKPGEGSQVVDEVRKYVGLLLLLVVVVDWR